MNVLDERDVEATLLARVYSEYLQMPGLQLTVAQAARLWNMNLDTSVRVLDALVDLSFLRRSGNQYGRVDYARMCA